MANAAKAKGDRTEREAVEMLCAYAPDLVREGAGRMFGAGRKDDVGDLRVFDDTVIQAKGYAMPYLATGLRTAAISAVAQRENALAQGFDAMRFAVGLVPIPRQPTSGAVRWLAACAEWPVELAAEPPRFASVAKLLPWIKDDEGPHGYLAYPREQRIGRFGQSLTDTVLVAPIEAWLAAYRQARAEVLATGAGQVSGWGTLAPTG